MARINTPPVQVAAQPQYRQGASEINPFEFEVRGTFLYQVLDASQVELPQGWSMATTMETVDPMDPEQFWCTGFFLDPRPCPEWR